MRYKDIVENTILSNALSNEEQDKIISPLNNYINARLPKKLYRYRTCSERHFDAFFKDELWFSNGNAMNDDFDARLYYDRENIRNWMNSFLIENKGQDLLNDILSVKLIPDEIEDILPGANASFAQIKNTPIEQITKAYKELMEWASYNLEKVLENTTEGIRSLVKFACLAERIDSDLMWGHYSENASGFAIEYKFDEMSFAAPKRSGENVTCSLFPMVYQHNQIDATEYAKWSFQRQILSRVSDQKIRGAVCLAFDKLNPCPDASMSIKVALNKSLEWKPEKEWRVFIMNDIQSMWEPYTCVTRKPSALYLGRKISAINQKILLDMAFEKKIPVYKMNINAKSAKYRLIKNRII